MKGDHLLVTYDMVDGEGFMYDTCIEENTIVIACAKIS